MEKKVVAIGNSLGIVIDKNMRAELGIRPTTVVRMMTHGKRLIVEACGDRGDQSAKQKEEALRATAIGQKMQARAIGQSLLMRWGVANQYFTRLTAGFDYPNHRFLIIRYSCWVDGVTWERLTDAEHRLIRRMEVFHTHLENDAGWEGAIAAALAAEPFDRNAPAERAVGMRN